MILCCIWHRLLGPILAFLMYYYLYDSKNPEFSKNIFKTSYKYFSVYTVLSVLRNDATEH